MNRERFWTQLLPHLYVNTSPLCSFTRLHTLVPLTHIYITIQKLNIAMRHRLMTSLLIVSPHRDTDTERLHWIDQRFRLRVNAVIADPVVLFMHLLECGHLNLSDTHLIQIQTHTDASIHRNRVLLLRIVVVCCKLSYPLLAEYRPGLFHVLAPLVVAYAP